MKNLQRIQSYEHLKILSDSRRLTILRLLMSRQATLSQLGEILNEQPSQIRYHLKLLESAGLVELVDTHVVRGFVEKYYRATAHAFTFHELILPAGSDQETVVLVGSHDLALDMLANHLHQQKFGNLDILLLAVGSLEGLIALRQGIAQVASCHLLDAESGEYNLPYIRHLFPDRPVGLVTMAYRQQGLLVAPGNPLGIRSLEDLVRPEVTIINRNRGSGTRLWLDNQLAELGISPENVQGYGREVNTHTAVAEMISAGKADLGLGLQAAARGAGLDFIPLFQERFDLVAPQEQLGNHRLQPFFDYIQSRGFRNLLESLGGYDTLHTGDHLTA